MTMFIVAAVLAVGQTPAKPAEAAADGNWIVVSFEKSGQPVATAVAATATAKDGMLTFVAKDDKTPVAGMKLEFGPQSTVRVTEQTPATERTGAPVVRSGVYVLTKDYLALTIQDTDPTAKEGDTPASPKGPAFCSVVLKRIELVPGDKPLPGDRK